jgi:uncharacterized membrane protein
MAAGADISPRARVSCGNVWTLHDVIERGIALPVDRRYRRAGSFPLSLGLATPQGPALIAAPQVEGVWIGFGEIAMLLAGGWVLFARFSELETLGIFKYVAGDRGIRIARIIFGLALIPVGLGHIFYVNITASLIPSWMPIRLGLAYLTGVGQIACGLGVLFLRLAHAAALIEVRMLALFALLVWGPDTWVSSIPKLAEQPPGMRFPLTAFLITWVIGASALLVATNITSNQVSARGGRLHE